MIVERANPVGTMALQSNPYLQRITAPRAHEAPCALIGDALSCLRMKEIRCLLRECGFEIALVADQQQTSRERQKHHFVRVPRHRARVLDPAQTRAVLA